MKKLIIAAAIVCAAAVSQAAAIGWSCAAADWKGADYSLFVVGKNGVTGADQIKAIVAAGGLASASEYAFASASVPSTGAINQAAATSGKSITWTSGTENYTGFIFVENTTAGKASYTGTANVQLQNDTTGKSFAFGQQSANFAANTFDVAPEPTSGLLLLLGVAGLALKRRRA